MRRFLLHAAVSIVLWAIVVGATWWWLMHDMAAEQARGELVPPGEGDSPGLPLFGVAILAAVVLGVANAGIVAYRRWRRPALQAGG